MERFVETDYKFGLTFEQVKKHLHLDDEEAEEIMHEKYLKAKEIAKPKSVYMICPVEGIDGEEVTIGGTVFKSPVLAKSLGEAERVFAYVITCGTEIADWAHEEEDYIIKFWLDMLMEMIMKDARSQFFEKLNQTYDIGKFSTINPGSGNADAWPIAQQRQLFNLIGNVKEDTGVKLTASMLMFPTKSVSGVLFASDRGFVNCAFCLREGCPNRQVPYDPHALD